MLNEIAYLQSKGVDTSNLRVSQRAHVIMPYHIAIDTLEEAAKGDNKIGTTKTASAHAIWTNMPELAFGLPI